MIGKKINQKETKENYDIEEYIKQNMKGINKNNERISLILKKLELLDNPIHKTTENQKEIIKIQEKNKEIKEQEKFEVVDWVFDEKKKQWHILKKNNFNDFETEIIKSK